MSHPQQIALLHAGALGDAVLTLRLATALAKAFDPAHITLYARVDLSVLPGRVEGMNAFTHLETAGLHALFSEHAALESARKAELAAFDTIINCIAGPASTIHRRLGETTSSRVVSIDPAPGPDHTGHITDQWLADLARHGLTLPADTIPRIRLDSGTVESARAKITAALDGHAPTRGRSSAGWPTSSEVGDTNQAGIATPTANATHHATRTEKRHTARLCEERVVLLHPGSGGRDKCWPLARFEQLADALREDGLSPCFLLGPVEIEQHGDTLRARLDRRAPVLYDESLAAAAANVAAATAYVGNDAGMTHLAAALGTPTVALFGPTDPARWRPLGPHVTVLRADYRRTDPFDALTVDAVRQAVAGRTLQ